MGLLIPKVEFESPLGHVDKWNTIAPHEGDTIKYWRGRDGSYNNTAGENSRTAKLTDELVLEIRSRDKSETHVAIAKEFGLHYLTVSKIRRRLIWKHI